jgi:hypothetical protein
MFDPDYIPSVAEMDAMIRGRGTPVHPSGGPPSFEIPNRSAETRFDPDTGTLTVQCFRNPLLSESDLKYAMAAARKRAPVKRMVIMIEQSVLRDDINQMAWLTAKKFTRDIGIETFGGQLAFTRQFLPQ